MRVALLIAVLGTATLLGGATAQGQDVEAGEFGFDLYGFVKASHIYDTRQVLQVREGAFHIFPLDEADLDSDGGDDNATDNLGIFTFFSRLGLNVTGPDVLGAESGAVIEADFFGATNIQTSAFRLRNTYLTLDWGTHELLVGQYWSPLFTVAAFPRTVNTATGTPFNPFSRQPQVRFTYKPGALRVIGALSQQRDAFDERGLGAYTAPDGTVIPATDDGQRLQQQAALPGGHLQLQYTAGPLMVGGGTHVRWIRPELDGTRFRSGAAQAYARYDGDAFSIMAKGTYGNDMSDHLMLGGYVETVPRDNRGTQDADDIAYQPTEVLGAWLDAELSGDGPVAGGVFGGYQAQYGIGDIPAEEGQFIRRNSAFGANIDDLFRVSPRLSYTAGPLSARFELEVTSALYASRFDGDFQPDATGEDDRVTNVRGILALFYIF